MTIKMTETGCEGVIAMLRMAAQKVPDNARKVMHKEADKIVKLAKRMAPEDDAELMDAIHKEISYEARGRLKIDIVVGGVVRGVDVDKYAAEIHENYANMKPGPVTIIKRQIEADVYVGEKFLERAVRESAPKLRKALIDGIMDGVNE